MNWKKVFILCGLLLLKIPCLTYNQHTPETLTNNPVISQRLSITVAETKQLVTNTRLNPIYAYQQFTYPFRNHILQAEKRVTRTDNAVQILINY